MNRIKSGLIDKGIYLKKKKLALKSQEIDCWMKFECLM